MWALSVPISAESASGHKNRLVLRSRPPDSQTSIQVAESRFAQTGSVLFAELIPGIHGALGEGNGSSRFGQSSPMVLVRQLSRMESVVRTQKSILFCVLSACLLSAFSIANAIDNDPNKEYPLTEKHGPWMIMVATFRDIEGDRKKDGLTAEEAASHLVHELRSKGIPAYAFSQESKKEKINTYDRLGNANKRVYAAQREMVCVLAGNYPKVDDPVAQKTLTFIKKYQPKFMADKQKSGAVVRSDKDPFKGAFLTINPLLQPDEVASRKADQETRMLNSGIDYPLVKLDRKYTLKIATFTGKSAVPLGSSKFSGHEANFEKSLSNSGPYNLARAGEDATQLTYALRQNSEATMESLGRPKFEAYVYHDRFQSIVTVGGFNSDQDPDIRRMAEIFRAKYRSDQKGVYAEKGEYVLVGESLSLPHPDSKRNPDLKLPPIHTWAFDPVPELIEVPRIK